jgi:hypothetical protein
LPKKLSFSYKRTLYWIVRNPLIAFCPVYLTVSHFLHWRVVADQAHEKQSTVTATRCEWAPQRHLVALTVLVCFFTASGTSRLHKGWWLTILGKHPHKMLEICEKIALTRAFSHART